MGAVFSIDSCSASEPELTNDDYPGHFFSAKVDISAKESNCQYEYSLINKVHVFTAKDHYKFNLVTEDGTTIWHTMDDENYSEKILFDNEKKHIRIIIKGGDIDYRKEKNTWQLSD
ncbi:hypothetical protein MACJ_003439 [Theileria orientalis]|uniref:Uncharacterized protein n=1 Tax=Theileria orientalis TaxID=68886 RepID=A0A976SK85_THEOR|nr:hypothetical protein MACJ_003439 [Theileria orientalis]